MAYQRRVDAQQQTHGPRRKAAFKVAGEALSACADEEKNDKDKRAYYERAYQCFVEAGEDELAVRAHAKSIDETEAVQLLARNGQLDEAIALIKPAKGRSSVDPTVAREIIQQAQISWLEAARYQ